MQLPSRLLSACLVLFLIALVTTVLGLVRLGIPVNMAGMAAKLVCSGTFIAGRDPQDVLREDVKPASIALQLARVTVDPRRKIVVGHMPGSVERYAVWRAGRGCMLLGPGELPELPGQRQRIASPDNNATTPVAPSTASGLPMRPLDSARNQQSWPLGPQPLTNDEWPPTIDQAKLQSAVETAFANPPARSFSPSARATNGPNTRAVLVVHRGRLLIDRYGGGFDRHTPQLGWSMTKTMLSALAWKHFRERGIGFSTPIVNLMQRMPRVAWAAEWLRDERAQIQLSDLLTMRDGLDHVEGYSVWSRVPFMLFSVADIGRYAGAAASVSTPGDQWRYSSAVSNLLSRVLRDQFTTDEAYWEYPTTQLFDPIGASSAVIETDANGTFIASSYMWATPQDWARFGQLLANDGEWAGQQVLPAGWLAWATQPRGKENGLPGPYGAHVWLTHANNNLDCAQDSKLPEDGFVMKGHMGQVLAIFPTQKLLILRLGWATDQSGWNTCKFLTKVLGSFD